MSKADKIPQKGEIWLVKCDKIKGPGLIISGNIQNEFDKMVTVVMMTTDDLENIQPFEVFIENTKETGLDEPSKIVLNHPFTIFKELRLVGEKCLGIVNKEIMKEVQKTWEVAFDWE